MTEVEIRIFIGIASYIFGAFCGAGFLTALWINEKMDNNDNAIGEHK